MLSKSDWVKGVAHWREGETALISVAFTWRLPEARTIAEYYRAIGCTRIRIGGPGTFTLEYFAKHTRSEVSTDELATAIGAKPGNGHWYSGIKAIREPGLIEQNSGTFRVSAFLRSLA